LYNSFFIELKFVIGNNNTTMRRCIVLSNCLKILHFVSYRIGKEPADTTREQIIYARKLYESAFHPDTGDLQNVFGRMSFQVPGGMAITGAMLQFYRYFYKKFNWFVRNSIPCYSYWRRFCLITHQCFEKQKKKQKTEILRQLRKRNIDFIYQI